MKSKMIEKLMFGVIGVTTLGIVTVAGVQVVSLAGDGDTTSTQQTAQQAATPKAKAEREVAPDVVPVSTRTEASGRSDQAIKPVGDDDADDTAQSRQPAPVQDQTPEQPVNYDEDDLDDYDDRDDDDDFDDGDDLDDQGDDYDDDRDDLYDD